MFVLFSQLLFFAVVIIVELCLWTD